MNRSVRVLDRDGNSVLAVANRIVKVGESESFRDLFKRLLPESGHRVLFVQLTQAASTQAKDATETHDLDETVPEILHLVSASHGYDPMVITYVVAQPGLDVAPAPDPAAPPVKWAAAADTAGAPRTGKTQTSSDKDAECNVTIGSGRADADAIEEHATQSPSSQDPQQCPATADPAASDGAPEELHDGTATDDDSCGYCGPDAMARAAMTYAYLAKHGCSFLPDDPRPAVFQALRDAFLLMTVFSHLQLPCSVAQAELDGLALAIQAAPDGTRRNDTDEDLEDGPNMAHEILRLLRGEDVQRVWSRKEWQPVRCLLSAFCTKIAEDAGIRSKAAGQAELEDAVRGPACKHCGTECRPRTAGGKRRASTPAPNTPPPAKRARGDAAERPRPSAPPTGTSRVSCTLQTQDKSPAKKTRSARGSLPPPRLSIVESFCVVGSVERYRWFRFRPLQAVLASMGAAYEASETWQPSADAVVMVDAHWFAADRELSDRERQMKLRKAMAALMEGTTKFAFPYGVVSIRPKQASAVNGRKEWFVWRLPDGTASAVKEAHSRMVAFFKADMCTLRRNAASTRNDRRGLVHVPSQ